MEMEFYSRIAVTSSMKEWTEAILSSFCEIKFMMFQNELTEWLVGWLAWLVTWLCWFVRSLCVVSGCINPPPL